MIPVAPSAQAQATTIRLQAAARAGRPIMIPGAAPVRAAQPSAHLTLPDLPPRAPVAAGDVQRLQYRLEGGGASGARGLWLRAMLARLWRRG